jgi:zinc protease
MKVRFPEPPFAKDYEIESEIPKAALLLYWPSDDGIEARRHRRLALLGMVLNDRLRAKVREELGTSYSPRPAATPARNSPATAISPRPSTSNRAPR